MVVLTPVWLDSKNRAACDTYREGRVIERVGVKTRTLVLRDAAGQTHPLALRDIDKNWSLFRAGTIAVA
ncbi:hypothetical protein [Sodalis glossinidius]|uniref:hypothetical protein n=1 Tax=Sodalis glossinidius TaxID=63612 RepID=UPI0005A48405|nr:hypothetical protein [Sodalis glossinidius]